MNIFYSNEGKPELTDQMKKKAVRTEWVELLKSWEDDNI